MFAARRKRMDEVGVHIAVGRGSYRLRFGQSLVDVEFDHLPRENGPSELP